MLCFCGTKAIKLTNRFTVKQIWGVKYFKTVYSIDSALRCLSTYDQMALKFDGPY